MDTVLQALLTWQFILFSLSIASITLMVRRLVEYLLVNNEKFKKNSKLWRDVILPSAPMIIGMVFAILASAFPYPIALTLGGRIGWGLTSGLLSGWIYRIINAFIGNFVKSKDQDADTSDPNNIVKDKAEDKKEDKTQ